MSAFVLLTMSTTSYSLVLKDTDKGLSEKQTEAKEAAGDNYDTKLQKFGFGPAFYIINYDKEVLKDAKDVTTKGDSTISTSGSKWSASIGLETHFDISIYKTLKCNNANCDDKANWKLTTSHIFSPFLGLYDLDNGINGITAGFVYGIKREKDTKDSKEVTYNIGIGWTVHKDRLVLTDGVTEGNVPPAALTVTDYIEREDVKGYTLMISANIGF